MISVDKEYFEYGDGNVFSWSTKNLTQSQLDGLYQMIVENIKSGIVVPKQRLPDFYHNQILAEAIKGIRNKSILRYMEITKVSK